MRGAAAGEEVSRHRARRRKRQGCRRFGFFHDHDGENLQLWNGLNGPTLARLTTKVEGRLCRGVIGKIYLSRWREGFFLLRSLYGANTADFRATPGAIAADNGKTQFFISRAGADAQFAAVIGNILEGAGNRVILQRWDLANRNFMEGMHAALESGARVIALLSPAYFKSDHCLAEAPNTIGHDRLNKSCG